MLLALLLVDILQERFREQFLVHLWSDRSADLYVVDRLPSVPFPRTRCWFRLGCENSALLYDLTEVLVRFAGGVRERGVVRGHVPTMSDGLLVSQELGGGVEAMKVPLLEGTEVRERPTTISPLLNQKLAVL